MLAGDLALMFWLGLVIVGLALPGALMWMARKNPAGNTVLLVFLCVVIGGLVVRVMLFPLGLKIPVETIF